ncbi:hypothetical protein [Microbacterium maritypicum]|uniref:hypothetical protein n=1 Tax=Microbacterium maritypicum TaxID=33918 RepID=UPI003CEB886E
MSRGSEEHGGMPAAQQHRKADQRVMRWVGLPVFAVLAAFFTYAAVHEGVAAGWNLGMRIVVGRYTGPLWLHLAWTCGLSIAMTAGLAWSVWSVTRPRRTRRRGDALP